MFLHYLGKLKIQIFCRCGRKRKNAFLVAREFVIHPQILIFLVIERQGQDFDKKFVVEAIHSKEVNRRIS